MSKEKPQNPDLMRLDKKTEVEIFDAVRDPNDESPVMPVRLKNEDMFNFSCHRGVSCWNLCCHGADITLTPHDILRLSVNKGIRPREFLAKYTLPGVWERADLPVAKLKMTGVDGKGPCQFLEEEGCTVYEDRPATCRYYPLGLASIKPKGSDVKEDFSFLVKEAHCKGHVEDKLQTVSQFRDEQGIEDYDRVNRGWMDILMKMASWKSIGGPYGKTVSPQVKQMFFLVSTDIDGFRQFVFETKFLETYEIDPEATDLLKENDEALLVLGFDWMKNVMFQEKSLTMKENVLHEAIAKARENMGAA
ncbi:MAG: YkgJ family cysteine cluster protein [Rhodospirillales bacterium]|nr:YkgJ family cysteine cluster protein [Rhodospirillales bacterium]